MELRGVSAGFSISKSRPPLDLQIRIRPHGDTFSMEVQAGGHDWEPIRSSMTKDDLVSLNNYLRGEFEALVLTRDWGMPRDEKSELEQLRGLADAGWYAYKKVFDNDEDRALITGILEGVGYARIQITSESFYVPWELLYPKVPNKNLTYDDFWGFRHVISRAIPRSGSPAPEIFTRRPKVGLLLYDTLSAVTDIELKSFRSLHSRRRIEMERLVSLDNKRQHEGIEEVLRFLNKHRDIVHFGCHAVYKNDDPDGSWIMVADEFPVYLRSLTTYLEPLTGTPLVFLNACNTGVLNPLYTAHFTTVLLKHRARGVVATDCAVPDGLAAAFAQRLYEGFTKGGRLGTTLLDTRRTFLGEAGNPFGLMYAMYAHPDVRIVRNVPPPRSNVGVNNGK